MIPAQIRKESSQNIFSAGVSHQKISPPQINTSEYKISSLSEENDMDKESEFLTFTQPTFESYKSFCDFVDNKEQVSGERFNPYEDNTGTTVALKHSDFIIVAADTRHSSETGIYSRNVSKIFKINEMLMTVTGFRADGCEVYNKLMYHVKMYESLDTMNIHSLANLTSKILYSKRLFPYYAYISLSGFYDGKPYVYGYDCVGSYESVNCICNGSGAPLVQPLLDSFIDKKNWHGESPTVSEDYALNIVLTAFDSASERDIRTGDYLEIYILNQTGIRRDVVDLRKD